MQNKNRKKFFIFGVSFCLGLFFVLPHSLTAASLAPEKIISRINLVRSENKLPSLSENNLLAEAAANKLQDMISNDYFAHQNPQGKMAWDFMVASGYIFQYAGENLAMDYLNEKELVQAWMESNTHRKNILNEDFQDTGVAVAQTNFHFYIVEFFGATDTNRESMQNAYAREKATEVNAESTLTIPSSQKQAPNQRPTTLLYQTPSIISKSRILEKHDILDTTIINWLRPFQKKSSNIMGVVTSRSDQAYSIRKKSAQSFSNYRYVINYPAFLKYFQ
jgi:hypothetical protein